MASGSPSTPAHTCGDALGVAVAQRKAGARLARALHEQRHRVRTGQRPAGPRRLRQRHRRYRPDGLARHPEPGPARGQDDQPGSRLQQRPDNLGAAARADARSCRAPPARAATRGTRTRPATSLRPGSGRTPSACATAAPTRRSSANDARSTHPTPTEGRSSRSAANSSASRVLPQPPGPVSVTRRACPSTARNWASSRSRPTKLVNATGSPRGRPAPRQRRNRAAPGIQLLGVGIPASINPSNSRSAQRLDHATLSQPI